MKPRKNKSGSKNLYDESLKIAAARDYLTGNLSLSQVAEKYGIPGGRDTVRWFVKWYQQHYQIQLSQTNSSPPVYSDREKEEKSAKELQKQLSEANLKIAALEIMIQVAEQDLGIEIRKKRGTKQ